MTSLPVASLCPLAFASLPPVHCNAALRSEVHLHVSCCMLCWCFQPSSACAWLLQLLAVSTSKARLPLPQGGTFEDYLAAEYEADSVTETLIDPLNPNGLSPGGARDSSGPSSSSSSRYKQRGREGYQGEKAALTYGSGGEPDSMGLGSDADYDALMWNEPSSDGKKAATSSSSSRLFGKKGSSQPSGAGSTGDAAGSSSSSGGRLLRARCWMAQEFPMKLAQLLPLLDVIGTANKHMAKVGKFLAKYTELDMFPVKLQVKHMQAYSRALQQWARGRQPPSLLLCVAVRPRLATRLLHSLRLMPRVSRHCSLHAVPGGYGVWAMLCACQAAGMHPRHALLPQ